ncbi:MAG TPA: SUMF1/EgtB/PvdO family nonheme iron enzyme [Polyangiaceae bacterium]|nr:SUMF1/EgtB/PvdO family nonheme iron enzyme [Polyangiaceae bacterium]
MIDPKGRVLAPPNGGRRPAVFVSWYGAQEYCRAQGKRLPLDPEWEHAAKGRTLRPFAWGAQAPRPDTVAFGRSQGLQPGPREVRSSEQDRSPEGVFDLGGNVAEWVDDADGDRKTVRGGSWHSEGPCHLLSSGCAFQKADEVGQRDVGFRCARSVTMATKG